MKEFKYTLQDIPRLVKDTRLERIMTQEELADKVGCYKNDISVIEAGKRNLTVDTIQKLCEALKIKLVITVKR